MVMLQYFSKIHGSLHIGLMRNPILKIFHWMRGHTFVILSFIFDCTVTVCISKPTFNTNLCMCRCACGFPLTRQWAWRGRKQVPFDPPLIHGPYHLFIYHPTASCPVLNQFIPLRDKASVGPANKWFHTWIPIYANE